MSTVIQTLANNTIVLSEPGETDTYVTLTKIQQMSLLYSPPVQVSHARGEHLGGMAIKLSVILNR